MSKIVMKAQCGSSMQTPYGKQDSKMVSMHGVYEEKGVNKEWADSTPNLQFTAQIDNPAASAIFKQGKAYLVTIEPFEETDWGRAEAEQLAAAAAKES